MSWLSSRLMPASEQGNYERFQRRILDRRGLQAWMQLLFSQPRRLSAVSVWGFVAAVATALVPQLFDSFSDGLEQTWSAEANVEAAALLMVVVSVAAICTWLKERSELELVAGTRFLAFRSYFWLGSRASGLEESERDGGRHTTHPMQISQFAYVVDLVLTVIQSILVSVFVLVAFGSIGLVAIGGTVAATAISVGLVHAIGRVYARYVELESQRVERVRELSVNSDELRQSWLDRFFATWLQNVRQAQEPLLYRRARLQSASSLVASGTVPTIVAVCALLALVYPAAAVSDFVSLLVAAGILSSALQESVTNYRVVRLCVPMLKDWDRRREAAPVADRSFLHALELISHARASVLNVPASERSAFTAQLVASAQSSLVAYIPEDAHIPAEIVVQGLNNGDHDLRERLEHALSALNLTGEILAAGRLQRLSRGERVRLGLALVLADAPDQHVYVEGNALTSLDHSTRAALLDFASRTGGVTVVGTGEWVAEIASVWSIGRQDGTWQVSEWQGGGANQVLSSFEESEIAETELTAVSEEPSASHDEFDSPRPTMRSAWLLCKMTLGVGGTAVAVLLTAALALAGAALPIILSDVGSGRVSWSSAAALMGVAVFTLVALLALAWIQFRVPVARLSKLHAALSDRFALISSRERSGELVGRLGEDFSQMQMEVPGRLVGFATIVTSIVAFLIGMSVNSGWVAVAVVVITPFAFVVFRRGEKRLVDAVTEAANSRGRFFASLAQALGSQMVAANPFVHAAATSNYLLRESDFVQASAGVVRAMMMRRGELQITSLVVLLVGLVGSVVIGSGEGPIAPAVLAYFAYRVSTELPRLLESAQALSVALATGERVRALLTVGESHHEGTLASAARVDELNRIADAPVGSLTQLSGRSGVGKSVTLRAFQRMRSDTILLSSAVPISCIRVDELRYEGLSGSGPKMGELPLQERQELMISYALNSDARVIALDEAMSAYDSRAQLDQVARLESDSLRSGRKYVVVSHTLASVSPSLDSIRM